MCFSSRLIHSNVEKVLSMRWFFKQLGLWLLVILLYLFMLVVPLLQMVLYTYEAYSSRRWGWLAFCLATIAFLAWIFVQSWVEVSVRQQRRRDTLANNRELGVADEAIGDRRSS